MYQQQHHAPRGVSILTVGYNPYANIRFSTTGPAYPTVPQSSGPRRAFRSTAPVTSGAANHAQLLPEEPRSVSSTSSTDVWARRSRSLVKPNTPTEVQQQQQQPRRRHNRRLSTTSTVSAQSRRNSTTSVLSQPQNTWASRSRTPESQNKPAPCKVKVTSSEKVGRAAAPAPKKPQRVEKKSFQQTKEESIRAIYNKGEKFGKLRNNVWFKAPENGSQPPARKPARKNYQRPAAKKQPTVRRQAKRQAARASPETLKALKKLRKKVKQCTKIQQKLNEGLTVEVNERQKLNQLNDFRKQITVLEQQMKTGKARDSQGWQKVNQSRRR